MNANRANPVTNPAARIAPRPVAAALAGIGFAAALLAPAPAALAAEPVAAVVAREVVREPLHLAQALPDAAL
ncbi:MAG TPA: hypothetical protein PLK52_09610, partial [Usitatibacteraceae bacterium]|nr:hypothetical protein [Usitatibacteraceae bacterium]